MKTLLTFAAATPLAISAMTAIAKDLIVATDTAFVSFEFKQGDENVPG